VNGTEVLVGLVILVGLAGVLVPVLPGTVLILVGVLVWATEDGSATAWVVFSIAVTLLAAGAVAKYLLPGRRLKASGVPRRSMLLGGLLGVVGFFMVPVIGLLLGFVLGVYLSEHQRVGPALAWPSTKAALRAVGASMLIELAAALLASTTWFVGALLT
jgi:uncharacterized protein